MIIVILRIPRIRVITTFVGVTCTAVCLYCVTGIEDVSVTQLTEVVTVFVNFDCTTLFVMLDAGDEGNVLGDE